MKSPSIVDGLNEKQQQSVVLSEDINALILAGAGSGKTRVLTHRIHYLVSIKKFLELQLRKFALIESQNLSKAKELNMKMNIFSEKRVRKNSLVKL